MTRRSITFDDLQRLQYLNDPQMSPDGRRAVFTVKTVGGKKSRYLSHLWMVEVDTRRVWRFTTGEVTDSAPRWSPDGTRIAFLRTHEKKTQIWTIPVDGGEASPVTRLEEGAIGTPAWSPDGSQLAFAFRPVHPDWTTEASKKREEQGRSTPPRVITRLNYRLDGAGYLDLRQHIWVCDAVNGETRLLTDGEYDDEAPAWSPDGRWIAFVSNRSADPAARPYEVDLWLVSPQGGPLRKVPTPLGPKGWLPALSWSPDGARLAYTGHVVGEDPWATRHDRLWVVAVDDGSVDCLSAALDRTAMNATITDTGEMYGGGQRPIWSADAKQLFFLASDRGSSRVYTASLGGGSPEALTGHDVSISCFSADSQARRFALLATRPTHPPEVFLGRWAGEPGGILELEPLTQLNAPLLDEVRVSEPEQVWFQSGDGTDLQGWLLRPHDFDPEIRYPLLLYIHGGPALQYGNAFFHEHQALAARGYVILYTNPRGSAGYSEEFAACIRGRWGDLDFQDLMAAADYASALPYVDGERMAVAGGSYGGFMTNWIVSHTDRFRCAITERGLANLVSNFGTGDFPEMEDGYWPGNSWDRPEALWEQSPLRYAANIKTPLLIIHSENDLRCPIEQAEQLFVALKRLRREVLFVRYPRETSHGLSRSGPPDLRVDRLERIAAWLDRHLKA